MKAKVKVHTARNAKELAEILGLDPADAIEIEFRAKLNKKIIDEVKSQKLTHAEVAKEEIFIGSDALFSNLNGAMLF
jgi:hypothetical protein